MAAIVVVGGGGPSFLLFFHPFLLQCGHVMLSDDMKNRNGFFYTRTPTDIVQTGPTIQIRHGHIDLRFVNEELYDVYRTTTTG